uniref:Uncharacterized protein n=1 Tax=Tetranychus urticae TaxID=32264 RepID=T1KEL7_TETUR
MIIIERLVIWFCLLTESVFLQRYKCLSQETWPFFKGSPKEGVEILVRQLDFDPNEYRLVQVKFFYPFTPNYVAIGVNGINKHNIDKISHD